MAIQRHLVRITSDELDCLRAFPYEKGHVISTWRKTSNVRALVNIGLLEMNDQKQVRQTSYGINQAALLTKTEARRIKRIKRIKRTRNDESVCDLVFRLVAEWGCGDIADVTLFEIANIATR